jgi:hypothetical protein
MSSRNMAASFEMIPQTQMVCVVIRVYGHIGGDMTNKKHLATMIVCLAVLWACRLVPHSCETPSPTADGASPWLALVASGAILTAFLYVPVYDLIALLTYKSGLEQDFDPIKVYPGDHNPGDPPLSQRAKILLYVIDLAVISFLLLPMWIRLAFCR